MPFYYQIAIQESPLNGHGVFTLEDIPQGAVFWTFEDQGNSIVPLNCPNYDTNLIVDENFFKQMTDQKEIKEKLHATIYDNTAHCAIYFRDGLQKTNHSENTNCFTIFDQNGDVKKQKMIATRLIKAGEQIVDNYNGWHPRDAEPWFIELNEKYHPQDLAYHDSVRSQNSQYAKKQ